MARAPGLLWEDEYAKKVVVGLADNNYHQGRGVAIRLLRCIPTPVRDVPLDEIIEFKSRNQSEIQALRNYIRELYEDIERSVDKPLAERLVVERLERSVLDFVRLTREAKFAFMNGSIDASFNMIAALGAGTAAYSLGAEMVQIGVAALAGGAIGIGPSVSLIGKSQNSNSPFSFIAKMSKRPDWN
jgi:hypothetical protein